MIRFLRIFSLRVGLIYLLTYSGLVFIGQTKSFLLCILLCTICSYITEILGTLGTDYVTNSVYALFMSQDEKIAIQLINLIISLCMLTVVPAVIIDVTSGILVWDDNIFIKIVVVLIIWLLGYVPPKE